MRMKNTPRLLPQLKAPAKGVFPPRMVPHIREWAADSAPKKARRKTSAKEATFGVFPTFVASSDATLKPAAFLQSSSAPQS